ncbi:MAG TPA: sialate O-acetylesterase [Candidatus Didemnitutus sp.]|nr:sialate O-acetylesterase [Candidatus Didemnitutus sp.]
MKILAALASSLVVVGIVAANSSDHLAPASLFSDHAVLQCDQPVPIWGVAAPGSRVTVAHRGQTVSSLVGPDGKWTVTLAALPATASGAALVISSDRGESVTFADVVVGEVWLASGQSNMEWPLQGAQDGAAVIAAADLPLVRELHVERSPADQPASTVRTSGWRVAGPQHAGDFSAVGFFFARALSAGIKVPVGIIHSSWGGTEIESWLAEPVLRRAKAWPGFDQRWQEALKVFPQKQAEYPALDAAWQKQEREWNATGKPFTMEWPHPPVGPGTAYAPGALCNGMILPLAPYALRGFLWYQGESNVPRAGEYAELLALMIRDWRARWGGAERPFLIVQLPNFSNGHPEGRDWAKFREAQTRALALPNVTLAVNIDVGDANDLHPPNKRPVGERLALIAENQVYGRAGEWTGPVFQSATRSGAGMRVRFSHAADLVFHGQPTAFEVAGADHVFHVATARIDDRSVQVESPEVPEPVAVRYAWTNSPVASLFNGAGLPAAPFRSDDW